MFYPTPLAALFAISLTGCVARVGFDSKRDASPGGDRDGGESLCTGLGLTAHWPLDELGGTTVADVAGGHDGTWSDDNDDDLTGETAAGHSNGALFFDTDSSVYVADFLVPAEGTFAAWVTSAFDDTDVDGTRFPILMDAPAPRTTIAFEASDGYYGLRTSDISWRTTFSPASDITGWFHIAATWSAGGAQLYFDGAPAGAPGTADSRSTSPRGLYIGTREAGARWWQGFIDDVRVYDRALDASEVALVYACP